MDTARRSVELGVTRAIWEGKMLAQKEARPYCLAFVFPIFLSQTTQRFFLANHTNNAQFISAQSGIKIHGIGLDKNALVESPLQLAGSHVNRNPSLLSRGNKPATPVHLHTRTGRLRLYYHQVLGTRINVFKTATECRVFAHRIEVVALFYEGKLGPFLICCLRKAFTKKRENETQGKEKATVERHDCKDGIRKQNGWSVFVNSLDKLPVQK